MAQNFIIHAEHRVVFSYTWGTLSLADVIDHHTRLAKDARFCPDFRQIADFTDLTAIDLSRSEIELLASEHIFDAKTRRAFIAVSSLQHGMSRMFQTYGNIKESTNVAIFSNLLQAVKWIDVPAAIAKQAFSQLRSEHDLA
jgi:hypothetical protein